jgi:hypothetical protein
LAAIMGPRVYQQRSELQANRCKRMRDHGALNTHEGRKKLRGTARHQHRAKEQLAKAWGAAPKRVGKKADAVKTPQATGAAAASQGHKNRLEQRQRALAGGEQGLKDAKHPHDKLAEQAAAFGAPGERAERDFRKQTIMTFRPLL